MASTSGSRKGSGRAQPQATSTRGESLDCDEEVVELMAKSQAGPSRPREPEPQGVASDQEDSDEDEDTEDASEDEDGCRMRPAPKKVEAVMEMKEQAYREKLCYLKGQLKDLEDGVHPEYVLQAKHFTAVYRDRVSMNSVWKEIMTNVIESDFATEVDAARREFDEKKEELRDSLLAELEEKKKQIELERTSIELDILSPEVRNVPTRNLRRRPNEPAPASVPEKKRNVKPALITSGAVIFELEATDVDSDLTTLTTAIKTPVSTPQKRKAPAPCTVTVPDSSDDSEDEPSPAEPVAAEPVTAEPAPAALDQDQGAMVAVAAGDGAPALENPPTDIRVEGGKLFYEKRWFHRGQPIFIEGCEYDRAESVILAINPDRVCLRNVGDTYKVEILLSQLISGKYAIKRRA